MEQLAFISSRRLVMKKLLGATAGALLSGDARASFRSPQLIVTSEGICDVPADFTGLSYESSQLSHPDFFSAANSSLIRMFRNLNNAGVLRVGGNTSEYTMWKDEASTRPLIGEIEGPDPGKGLQRTFELTRTSITNLSGFLHSADWKLIYGLNLRRTDIASSLEEASFVAKTIGNRLIALQFGNEPDLFKELDRDAEHKWSYDEYTAKWKELYRSVHQRLPGVPIAGPDTSDPAWISRFAYEERNNVAFLTGHYYAEGPPSDPNMTIDYLLNGKERFKTYIEKPITAAGAAGLSFRMAEGNSCYAAGKAGVSDTFASALWVIELMLSVAQSGGKGVNLHGGGNGFYTPIAGTQQDGFTARPIYYGMLMFRDFLGSTMLKLSSTGLSDALTAFASHKHSVDSVLLINRGAGSSSLELILQSAQPRARGTVRRLQAPAVDSKSGVTLAGQSVQSDGLLTVGQNETVQLDSERKTLISLPAFSAALLSFPR